ncbi:MAG: DUF87 domain-containing protein [Candidatus Paceibacterota bacterium]|jgi:hypothetical protein
MTIPDTSISIPDGYAYILAGSLSLFLLSAYIVEKRRRSENLEQSLGLVLLSIKVPNKTAEEIQQSGKQEKDWIKIMEDFYDGMVSLKKQRWFSLVSPWISLEIAKIGEEICFYAAAPDRYADLIEKKLNGLYPDAQIERCKDFNIFGLDEEVCCGYARTEKPVFLPIKTYNYMETDPLASIANVLTKLKEKEEAAVQIIFKNDPAGWHGRGKKIIDEMAQGKNFREAMSATGTFGSFESKKEKEKKAQDQGTQPKADEELIKMIENKLARHSFEANVRIIVSIKDKVRSEQVFEQLAGSLGQFSSPKLNNFHISKLKKGGAKKLLYDYSFRNFNSGQAFILSTEEMTSIFHLPTPLLKTPNIKTLSFKVAPAPAYLPGEGLLLGFNQYRGGKKDIRIGRDDRRRHLYVIGQTGTGKSAFLSNLIEQDVLNGDGVGVLDPHGDLIDDILGNIPNNRVEDTIVFDPTNLKRSIGLNMLEYDPNFPEQKTFIVNEFIKIFDKLYDLKQTGGPIFEQYTRNALMLLMDDPNETYTLMEVPKVLADSEFRHRLLAKCRNLMVKEFWENQAEQAGGESSLKNLVPYITSKFDTFISNDYMRPILGQTKSTFNFREILDTKKIFLVNLSKGRLGDINSSLLGLIITSKLAIAAFSRVDTPEKDRKDFYLYLDEFQNFATDTISSILSEARKYKLCLTLSHQFIGQLPEMIRDSVFGNIGTFIAFRVGVEDAEYLKKEFDPVFNAQDLIKIDNFNAYIRVMASGQISAPFNIKTYAPSESDRKRMQNIKDYYSLKWGISREIVEEGIENRRRKL